MNSSTDSETVKQELQHLLTPVNTVGGAVKALERNLQQHNLFYGHGTDNASDEAYTLVFTVLGLDFAHPDQVWNNNYNSARNQTLINIAAQRIVQRIPLPYLTGEAWFAGLRLKIDARAIIPRSPLAELARRQFLPWLQELPMPYILDMCAGSGCIGIAAAVYIPHARVDLVDLSADALALSRENIQQHHIADRVKTIRSNLFNSLPARKYDLIVSNPPYVSVGSMRKLPLEYRHEPVMALQADDEGMAIIDRIISEASDYLTDNGILIVEVGETEQAISKRYTQLPFTWLVFEQGGEGVFLLHKKDLNNNQPATN